jgi:hypothetical protein
LAFPTQLAGASPEMAGPIIGPTLRKPEHTHHTATPIKPRPIYI